jgi:hypothetical protein
MSSNNRFTSTNPILDVDLDELVSSVIIDLDNLMLFKIPKEREIYLAISQLGPDGMTRLFYKTYWPIVKVIVIAFVQSCFRGGFFLKEINHTNMALIPKIDNPSRVNQFRSINLINFNYKIISKILANRFKILVHKFVSPYQLAFIKGQFIQDNNVMAHEIFHSLIKK